MRVYKGPQRVHKGPYIMGHKGPEGSMKDYKGLSEVKMVYKGL